MKKSIIISAAIVTIMLASCKNSSNKNEQTKSTDVSQTQTSTQTFDLDTTKLKSGETFYQCPMHPEVLSDRAGICPKCEMELSEMKKL